MYFRDTCQLSVFCLFFECLGFDRWLRSRGGVDLNDRVAWMSTRRKTLPWDQNFLRTDPHMGENSIIIMDNVCTVEIIREVAVIISNFNLARYSTAWDWIRNILSTESVNPSLSHVPLGSARERNHKAIALSLIIDSGCYNWETRAIVAAIS